MSAELGIDRRAPTIIQKASEQEKSIAERTRRARQLRQEAEDILRAGWTESLPRRFGKKPFIILETEIADGLGGSVPVAIYPRDKSFFEEYESDLKKAAIEIRVGGYDSLILPPARLHFDQKDCDGEVRFPLPEDERLEQYEELLEAVRKDLVNSTGKAMK